MAVPLPPALSSSLSHHFLPPYPPLSVQSETALMHSWVLEGVKSFVCVLEGRKSVGRYRLDSEELRIPLEPRTTSLNKSEVKMHVGL